MQILFYAATMAIILGLTALVRRNQQLALQPKPELSAGST
jgi:hypothetical protein